MRFTVLGSGSKGNSTLVRGQTTTILIDAGFSGKEIIRRLAMVGVAPEEIDAILVTHEHNDHISGVGVLSRRLDIPVFANVLTHRSSEPKVGALAERRDFETGEPFAIGDLEIHPFSVSHDTADPVGYVIGDGTTSLGYCTDTGKITNLIRQRLRRCQAIVLEANHDRQMLRDGPYPLPLQQRVASSQGHLANPEALACAAALAEEHLKLLVLAHLSEVNNHPDRVRSEALDVLGALHCPPTLLLASQSAPTGLLDTEGR